MRDGYHYVVFVPDPGSGISGKHYANYRSMVQCQNTNREQGSIFMHELGHSLGLHPDVYRGIDSQEVSISAYPSIMNYNMRQSHYGYTGEDAAFNDWGYIASNIDQPPVQ